MRYKLLLCPTTAAVIVFGLAPCVGCNKKEREKTTKRQAAEITKTPQELALQIPKDEEPIYRVKVFTVQSCASKLMQELNKGLTVAVSRDLKRGELVIRFNYNDAKVGKWLIGGLGVAIPLQFMVRLFDKDKEHIMHFSTKERWVPESRMRKLHRKRSGAATPMAKLGNLKRARVNVSDLRKTIYVQVGFYWYCR